MRLEGWMKDGLMSNEAFINNADSSSSSNDPLGVLLEAPLGAYRRLKMQISVRFVNNCHYFVKQ